MIEKIKVSFFKLTQWYIVTFLKRSDFTISDWVVDAKISCFHTYQVPYIFSPFFHSPKSSKVVWEGKTKRLATAKLEGSIDKILMSVFRKDHHVKMDQHQDSKHVCQLHYSELLCQYSFLRSSSKSVLLPCYTTFPFHHDKLCCLCN